MESSYALAEPSPPISCPTKIPWYPPPPSWVKMNVDVARSSSKAFVRLNLFNHVLALFCAKFTCNSVIRNLVFRWELCKGCMWESVKIWWSAYNQRAFRDTHQKCHMCEVCRKLKGHDSWIITRQKSIVWPFC